MERPSAVSTVTRKIRGRSLCGLFCKSHPFYTYANVALYNRQIRLASRYKNQTSEFVEFGFPFTELYRLRTVSCAGFFILPFDFFFFSFFGLSPADL